jgi:drug/metabolite transporter (DMT)-like permease
MSGTLVSFMAMAIGGRELSAQLSTFQILFFRSIIGCLIVGFFLGCSNWRQILTKHLQVHLLRNIAHFGGQFGWFYGIALIPLAEVFALEFTVPVWTAVLATLLLREQITRARVGAIILGVLGVFLILRPGLAVISPAALAVLGSAFCYALSHTLTRRLALVDTPLTILFYMTTIQLPLGFVTSIFDWMTTFIGNAALDHCRRRCSIERSLLYGTRPGNRRCDCRGAHGFFEIAPDCSRWFSILW